MKIFEADPNPDSTLRLIGIRMSRILYRYKTDIKNARQWMNFEIKPASPGLTGINVFCHGQGRIQKLSKGGGSGILD